MPQRLRNLFLIWSGVAFGISMLATPAKFLAPDPSLVELLQVGRVTFRVQALAEIALLLLAFALVLLQRPLRPGHFTWPAVIAVILIFQYAGVLPILNTQTDLVMAGEAAGETTFLHTVYVGVEVLKIGLLLFLGLRTNSHV